MDYNILNLYAGIGGNRKQWPAIINNKNVKITSIENNKSIAQIYKHYFPKDNLIITDAHEYLLTNINKFDFIWASPPCQKHSRIGRRLRYIDLTLWQEIILLQSFCKTKFVVENVKSYYKPLIEPTAEIGRHYFWSNFKIEKVKTNTSYVFETNSGDIKHGFHLSGFKTDIRKDQIIRNTFDPYLALHILNESLKK